MHETKIYFLRCTQSGYIKIGHTRSLAQRLPQLQIGSPYRQELVAAVSTGQRVEREIHFVFRNRLVQGEWYRLSDKGLEWAIKYAKDRVILAGDHVPLKLWMDRHGVSGVQLAKLIQHEIGVAPSISLVSKWKQGARVPTKKWVPALEAITGESFDHTA